MTPAEMKDLLSRHLELPELIKEARRLPFGDNNADWRPLAENEITELKDGGNRSSDWSLLRVHPDFTAENIHDSTFHGFCRLGIFNGVAFIIDEETKLPDGIYSSIISDSTVMNGSLVLNTGLLSRYLVMENSLIMNCGTIAASSRCSFGIGKEINPGSEAGGREIAIYPEGGIEPIETVIRNRKNSEINNLYLNNLNDYIKACTFNGGIIGGEVKITGTPKITGSYIGRGSRIEEATLIEDSVLLSDEKNSTRVSAGSIVRSSALQWGAEATDLAIVDSSLLMEYSSARRHGKVTESVIGSNTEVAEGEVTSSLMGPFTGFHHQSLLIAALWPQGRGNVGYGANVGSNHTGKAPDQEIICGEGMFFGLGSSIKFPANYEDAPYTIIATGVTTLPQKVEYPFSLINSPGQCIHQVPQSYNEISAGWVLTGSLYTVMRNRLKFKKRNRATRFIPEPEIFRYDLAVKVKDARDRLQNIQMKREIYLDRDIPGIGKNYMTERSRKSAVYIYSLFIECYVLLSLLDYIKETDNLDEDFICKTVSKNSTWEKARLLMHDESWFPCTLDVAMKRLIVILEKIVRNTRTSKERDDGRGKKIIPDYDRVTTKPSEDTTVIDTTAWGESITADAEKIISRL